MKGIPPQLLALFCIMFIALGIFNILMTRQRRHRNGLQQVRQPWYKEVGILTGIEYILLASVFLINIGISYKALPPSLNGIIFPFFIVLLLASGLLAGFVIYQGFANVQRRRTLAPRSVPTNTNGNARIAHENAQEIAVDDMAPEERSPYMQKRRERRQKAASARRRRAGKT